MRYALALGSGFSADPCPPRGPTRPGEVAPRGLGPKDQKNSFPLGQKEESSSRRMDGGAAGPQPAPAHGLLLRQAGRTAAWVAAGVVLGLLLLFGASGEAAGRRL